MKGVIKVIIIFLLVSVILVGVSILMNLKNEEGANVQGDVDYSVYPAVTNIAPGSAFVGAQYRYDVAIVDADSRPEEIRISLMENPKWIDVYSNSIFGTPEKSDIGTHKIVFEVSDGSHSVFETFYVIVSDSNEGI